MTNTTAEAIAWMKNEQRNGGPNWRGLCLMDVRISLGIASRYPSAANAWENANYKHRVSSGAQCPRGTAVFWTGGSSGYGHVVLSVGGGMCYSNDIKRSGHIDLARIDDITRQWGQNFQGWTEDLNGVHYYNRESEWASGDVYVEKLKKGQRDSDSVRRLQYRLLHHPDVPAKDVRLTGFFGEGTASALSHWQRKESKQKGPKDGTSISNPQANALFGKKYHVREDR